MHVVPCLEFADVRGHVQDAFFIANICPIFLGFSRIFVSLFNAHQVIMDFNSDGDEAPAEAEEAAPKKKKGKKQPQHEG